MPDYSKSKIYKIVDNTNGNIYIGSTTQSLVQRLAGHVRNYNHYLNQNGNNVTSYQIIQNNNYDIVLIEEVACENKEQLHAIERKHIESNKCVNKYIPGRTSAEYDKQYRNLHLERIHDRDKRYYQENKELIYEKRKEQMAQYQKTQVVCECGATVCRGALSIHRKSAKHLTAVSNQV